MGIRKIPLTDVVMFAITNAVLKTHKSDTTKIRKMVFLILEVGVVMPYLTQRRCVDFCLDERDAFETFFDIADKVTEDEVCSVCEYLLQFTKTYDAVMTRCKCSGMLNSLTDCNYLMFVLVVVMIMNKFNEDELLSIEYTHKLFNLIRKKIEKGFYRCEVRTDRYLVVMERFVFRRVSSFLYGCYLTSS